MKEFFSTLRLACYVCALPLIVTAAASAHHLMSQDDNLAGQDSVAVSDEIKPMPTSVEIEDTRTHVFTINDAGEITGLIAMVDAETGQQVGGEGISVTLNRRGQEIGSGMTDRDGRFVIGGMDPGAYTMIARGDNALVAIGAYIEETDQPPSGDETQFEIMAAGNSLERVRELLNAPIGGEVAEATGEPVSAADVGLPLETGTNRVMLTGDGNVVGRVAPLEWEPDRPLDLRGNQVYLIQDNQDIAESSVNTLGQFELVGIQAGTYEFVSVGPHGSAAFCLEVVANPQDGLNALWQVTGMFTGMVTATASSTADTVLTEPNAAATVAPAPVPAPIILITTTGGAGGGCCGGGGGYGGGGGAFGGDWLGAALGAAVLLYALNQIDDDRPFVPIPPIPPPISPISP